MPLWRERYSEQQGSRPRSIMGHDLPSQPRETSVGERTPWPFETTETHPHPSDLGQTDLYKAWAQHPDSQGASVFDRYPTNPAARAPTPSQPEPTPPATGAVYGGGGGGGIGYQAPTHMPQRPQLPATAPVTPPTSDQVLGLPEVPDYYSGVGTQIADPYADLYPGTSEADRLNAAAERMSAAVVGRTALSDADRTEFGVTGEPTVHDVVRLKQMAQESPADRIVGDHYWDEVQQLVDRETAEGRDYYGHLDPNIHDPYAGWDPSVEDRYAQIDPRIEDRYSPLLDQQVTDYYQDLGFDVPDYYDEIGPIGYEHYLGLDPTQPDYYSRLEDLIEEIGFEYDPLDPEQKRKLAEEYAAIQVDPQISAINRAIEQAKLDADTHEERVKAAASGYEEALARREEAQGRKDLESAIARGGARAGAVEWLSAERQGYHLEKLASHEAQVTAEINAIANQLGLSKRQMEERKIELEEMRGQLTNQELQRLREQEWERQVHGDNWMFEASMAVADRLAQTDRWEYEQAAHVADRLSQIDQFNAQQEMSVADRRTALDQWMKEMDMQKADRQTALEQWEQERQIQIADRLTSLDQWMKEMEMNIADRRTALDQWTKEMDLSKKDRQVALEQWERGYELEIAHAEAQEDARFREWEGNMRMAIGDRKYESHLQDFHNNLELRDRTYQQAMDEFTRELQVADRLTQRDIDEMARALDVYDRTQLNTAQQYELWVTLAEVTGVFPDRLPGT